MPASRPREFRRIGHSTPVRRVPKQPGMELRHLTEHRMRIERRRGVLIVTGVTLFALAARLLMF